MTHTGRKSTNAQVPTTTVFFEFSPESQHTASLDCIFQNIQTLKRNSINPLPRILVGPSICSYPASHRRKVTHRAVVLRPDKGNKPRVATMRHTVGNRSEGPQGQKYVTTRLGPGETGPVLRGCQVASLQPAHSPLCPLSFYSHNRQRPESSGPKGKGISLIPPVPSG